MSNRVLKTGLLSLTAASLLTTSAFAKIETEIESRTESATTLYLNKAGTTEEIFRIIIDNTDATYSKLESLSLSIDSTEADLSFLKQISVYKGNQQADNIVKNFPITDENLTATTSIDMNLDFTDVTSDKIHFINTVEGNPTSFIIVLDFNAISGIDDAELNATLNSNIEYTYRQLLSGATEATETENEILDDTLVAVNGSAAGTLPVTTDNFKIDTTNPYIVDVGIIQSTTTTGKASGVASDNGNIAYDYNSSFDVNISLSENLSRDYTGATYVDYLNDVTNAFTFKDGADNQLTITQVKSYQAGDTYSLETTTGDKNSTILALEVQSSVPVVGDVTMSYAGNYLKDEAYNYVQATTTDLKVFDDTIDPAIEKVYISFEDTTKGQIIFSEMINESNLDKLDIFGSEKNSNNRDYIVTLDVDNIETKIDAYDSATYNRQKTVIPFTLDQGVKISSVDDGISDFNITINGVSDTNLTYALHDMGGNYVINVDKNLTTDREDVGVDHYFAEGEFTTENILTEIVPGEWNLISIPSDLVTTSQHMFVTGTVQTIWGYEDGTWTKSPKLIHAGKGYWVKGLNITDSHDRNFSKTQATGYKARTVTSSTVITDDSSTDWRLLGLPTALDWANAHEQVHENCHTVSIYSYRPNQLKVDNSGANGTATYSTQTAGWNLDSNVSGLSGIWTRQENCK